MLLIGGEAGIGKSRLVAEAAGEARSRGFQLVMAAADEIEQDRPFGVMADALGLHPRATDPERAEIGRLIDGEDVRLPASSIPSPVPDRSFRIVELVVSLVQRLAADAPVMLVLEDLHWADVPTLRTVRSMVGALPRVPLTLLATFRPFPTSPYLDRVMVGLLAGGARQLDVGALDPDQAMGLAAAVAGHDVGPGLAQQVRRASGNPMFIIELVTALREQGLDAADAHPAGATGSPLPASLPATILGRMASLPAATSDVIRFASILGGRCTLSQLAALMSRSPADLVAALDPAIRAGLLSDSDDRLSFRHDVIRQSVYASVPAPVRAGLHREAARTLRAAGASPVQVAEHLFLGASHGDAEARCWMSEAARQAAPRSPAAAVRMLDRAVELSDADDPDTDLLVAELAPLLIQIGRAADAERLSRQVLSRGPRPAVEVALRRSVGEVLWAQGWLESAIAELEVAAQVPGGAEAERLGSLALASHLRLFLGATDEARLGAQDALVDARRLGDDFALCLTLQTLAVAAVADADVSTALELATEAVTVVSRSSQPRVGILHPHLHLGLILLDADLPDEAQLALQAGRRRAEERGTVVWLPLYHCVIALARVLVGAWDDAVAEVEAGLAVAEEVGTRLHVSFLHGLASWVAVQRGEICRAQAHLDDAVREFLDTTSSVWKTRWAQGLGPVGARWPLEWGLWTQALLREAQSDAGQALVDMEEAWKVAAPLRYLLGHRAFGPDLVRLAMAGGATALAAAVTGEVEEGARRSGARSAAGAALCCRGLVEDDPDTLLAAVEQLRLTAFRVELARALELAGLALGRAGRCPEAVAALEEAGWHFESFKAGRNAARIDAALRDLGVRRHRAGVPRRAAFGWDSLTDREASVARLVTEGLTNRQIGERLFVSGRTVETHVKHIFAKLAVSTRAQLAAEVARRT